MVEVQQANEAARRSEEQLRLVEKRVSGQGGVYMQRFRQCS